MKVVILGYNIFSPGGTTRSNINLITEFQNTGDYQITYYNYTEFSKMDLITLNYQNPVTRKIKIKNFNSIGEEGIVEADYYYITKETFFPMAKIIRSEYPHSTIIGEIHAPMDMIYTNFTPILPYFSYIRVATESIKSEFSKRFDFERVYVQNVSLAHIKPVDKIQEVPSNNFVILSRFDEQSKDISYAIKLMDYVVNYLAHTEIQLYIQGYGQGEVLYRNLINYYKLNGNVHINRDLPNDYTYLSTSRYETFGYSIIEAIFKGHTVCLYEGNDGVVKENFGKFKMVSWITKNLVQDSELLINLVQKVPNYGDYAHDKIELESYTKNYVELFEKNTSLPIYFNRSLLKKIDDTEVKEIISEVTMSSNEDSLRKYRLFYYSMKKWPLIGNIISSNSFRDTAKNLVTKYVSNRHEIEGTYVHDNYVFVESFHGKNFSGDPKYLALKIQEQIPNCKVFVSSVNQLVDMEIRSFGFEALRTGSKVYLERFSECKYIILNGNSIDNAGKVSGQIFIQTWHGFPMKKMVNDLENPKERQSQAEAFSPRMKKWDYLITSSKYNTELLQSAFHLNENRKLKVIESGAPKNEYLIINKDSNKEREKIYWKYFNRPYDKNKKFILFCPTWRKDKRKNISELDLNEVINNLPSEYEIIVKLHPNEGMLRKKYANMNKRIHCFYNELVDIQELYIISDVLISDYSSAIFDYAHLNKKIIVLQEDSEEYKKEVGWYFDIEKEYEIYANSYTPKELAEEILAKDNEKTYNELFTSKLLTNDSENSSENILKTILKGK